MRLTTVTPDIGGPVFGGVHHFVSPIKRVCGTANCMSQLFVGGASYHTQQTLLLSFVAYKNSHECQIKMKKDTCENSLLQSTFNFL